MHDAEVVALAFSYPDAVGHARLATAVDSLAKGSVVRRPMTKFLDEVDQLSLAQWEELHTDTLDLNPHVVPYVGHVTWGENYRRGEFMADLNRELNELGIDTMGELPDHLAPILRYLARAAEPLADLGEVLAPAVSEMSKTLDAASPKNPYRHVFAAAQAVVTKPTQVRIGALK